MLRELHISNLAVIEDATVELSDGLNCFTGQTGAGKSLIIGAFELLLGLRAGAELLRQGADEGRVSGVFEVHDAEVARSLGGQIDQSIEPGQQLLITRKLFASGRTSVSINGQPATAGMVRSVGELLVDIHGQHDHQFLLKPSNQLLILDTFADAVAERDTFTALFAELRDLKRRRGRLKASQTLREQQLELYEFQAGEIDAADPQPDEYSPLEARHDLLTKAADVKQRVAAAHQAMYDSEGSVVDRLQMITHVLLDLAEIDPEGLKDVTEQVRSATLSLQEAAYDLGRYVDRLEVDPGELAETADRLNMLNRLIAKYGKSAGTGEDAWQAVLDYRAQLAEQIETLQREGQDLSQIDASIRRIHGQLLEVGQTLRKKRQAAAEQLEPLVHEQLRELGMAEAELSVQFDPIDLDVLLPDEQGAQVPLDADAAAAASAGGSATGLDRVEMLVRTNPGQAARPLRKIASGGELSRLMLALKSILAGHDRISVLVFDEIDANIGGRMGTVIGQKLRGLTFPDGRVQVAGGSIENSGKQRRGRRKAGGNAGADAGAKAAATATASPDKRSRHQVLCITHLPQIAAFADRHLRIRKEVQGSGKDRQTRTTVVALEDDARVEELAEMLAGEHATATTRAQANEMIAAASK